MSLTPYSVKKGYTLTDLSGIKRYIKKISMNFVYTFVSELGTIVEPMRVERKIEKEVQP